MRTKIGTFCDRILEGGWLLAVVVTPLFFNIYSSRVFEPDKLTLLRSIALFMGATWLVKRSTNWFGEHKQAPMSEPAPMNRLRRPFIIPTLIIIVVYLISSLFSIAPRTSWLGSYQRLQGTFTTYSYIVIALIVMHELKRKEQFERLITTIILVSFPVSLYGIIQHYGIDAMPWGSDVTARVTSNMGNAIFVGAFIIMAIPLTLARLVLASQEITRELGKKTKWVMIAALVAVFAAELVAWLSRGLERGLGMGLLAVAAFWLLARYLKKTPAQYILLACYQFILSVQAMCLIYSQSRGPQLGMIAGAALFILLYFIIRRWSKAVWAWLAGGAVVAAFLIVFNLPATPLQSLRSMPYLGRLGNLLETSGGTGKVRLLIWEGAIKLIKANPLRALVGYGPETMYVAYNKYYPPELAHYEARNASPDRSHNETLDSFVITGVFGFLAYVLIFASIFYYALQWLGLIQSGKDKRSFGIFLAAGTLLGLVIPFLVDSKGTYSGVGTMIGFVAGLFCYIIPKAIAVSKERLALPEVDNWKFIWLAALASAVLAHLVEINFGIAIASTRTLFWVYLALIEVLGIVPLSVSSAAGAYDVTTPRYKPTSTLRHPAKHKHTSAVSTKAAVSAAVETESREPARARLVMMALILGYILSVMSWTFVTNANRDTDLITVLVNSFTTFAAKKQPEVHSLGMLWLMLSTLFFGCTVSLAEIGVDNAPVKSSELLKRIGTMLGISVVIAFVFAASHAVRLITVTDISTIIYSFYTWTALFWLSFATLYYFLLPKPRASGSGWSLVLALVLAITGSVLVDSLNIQPIKADIIYKQGLTYDEGQDWDAAIQIYNSAVTAAPKEDYYWLFYGRVLMERARVEENATARETYMQQTLKVLLEAQRLNPLNTDHTANLARFYRTWAEMDTDNQSKAAKIETALAYYQQANELSPNNAQIIDEWGQAYFVGGNTDRAIQKYQESLAIDSEYANTYFYLGDAKLNASQFEEAAQYYEKGLTFDNEAAAAWSALAYAYAQLGQVDKAIEANLKVVSFYPSDYNSLKNLALLYEKQGNLTQALSYAQQALTVAPEEQKTSMSAYITQLEQLINEGN
ncbi:MAG: O-antigen ligase family protein [Chloroflexi bacterium]|nr:O-antigen ligase family protein [Chloroflexota bacterium]